MVCSRVWFFHGLGKRRSGIDFCECFEHLRAYGFFHGLFFARIKSAVLSVKTFTLAIQLVLATIPVHVAMGHLRVLVPNGIFG
jgi:hypothetical protein